VRNTLTEDLGMMKVIAKMVASILFYKQKQRWLDASRQFAEENKLLSKAIMDDQSRCFQQDPQTKRQTCNGKRQTCNGKHQRSRSKKTCLPRAQAMTTLTCYFDPKCIAQFQFLEQRRKGTTIFNRKFL
jgi:hypothetical protein